jgi:flagellar biosynthesis/type III secretory pathway chaperone
MKIVEKLARLLERNAELYEELACKSIDERAAIESDGLEKLASITGEKESIVNTLRGVEEKRSGLVAEAAVALGMESVVPLKELANHPYASGERKKLLEVSERLRIAVERNDELNEFNRNLLAASMEFVRKSISFAAKAGEEAATYIGGKMVEAPVPSGSMVRKAY